MMRAAEVVEGNFRRFATHCRCNVLQNAFDERSEEHTSELQSRSDLVCRLLLEKKKNDISGNAENRQESELHIISARLRPTCVLVRRTGPCAPDCRCRQSGIHERMRTDDQERTG